MKQCLLVFLLLAGKLVSAQENDRTDFFPLHIGDSWEYWSNGGPTPVIYNTTIIGDTIVDNNLWYLYDSLPPVDEMVTVTDSLEVWRRRGTTQWTERYPIFDLGADIGEVYPWFLPLEWRQVKRITAIYNDWLLPSSPNPLYTTFMEVELGVITTEGDTLWDLESFDLLCKDVGLVLEMRPDGGASFLHRAEVNGLVVGYPSAMSIEDDHEVIINSRTPAIGNYPNPFREQTTICWQLASAQEVKIDIFDAAGRFVTTLFTGRLPAGVQSFIWNGMRPDGSFCGSGQYFFVLKGESFSDSHKLILKR